MERQNQVAQYLKPEASRIRKVVFDVVTRMTVDKERAKNIGMKNAIRELESARKHILRKFKEMVDLRIETENRTLSESVLGTAPSSIAAAKSLNIR